MKFVVSLVLMALVSYAVCLYLPFWGVALAAFVVAALIPQRPLAAWVCGFISLFLLWGWLSYHANGLNLGLLGKRMADILGLKGNTTLLMLITALIGGLLGSFGALTGSFLRAKKR